VIVSGAGFEQCFREHSPRLVAYGTSMTGDRDTGRELAQEAFLRLHANWSKVAGYDNPGTWLRRVVANLAIDRHRSQTSEQRALARLGELASTDRSDGADAGSWAALMSALPVRQRAIVTLHYGDDMSVADIADLLDISVNTVKSALSKARATLRAHREVHGRG
jgi:RNA polymerase sigma-70 factor (ECF subfamily)